jgi:preprotein translocase subunit SecD
MASGCSDVEPKTGTRVTFLFPPGRAIERQLVAETSGYLMMRSAAVLGAERSRVESVDSRSIVLLLPGKKIPRKEIGKLLESASLEFYHLARVATKGFPGRPWQVRPPRSRNAPYVFSGPNAQRIDSYKEPEELLRQVVGYPSAKPILTGKDVLPDAGFREVVSGWAVLIHFTKAGARKFHEFTRDNRGEYLAVFHNGSLVSAAVVGKPIKGGEVFLTGFRSADEAKSAVAEINAGHLPVKVTVKSVSYY